MVSTIFAFRKRKRTEFIELEQLSHAEKPFFVGISLEGAHEPVVETELARLSNANQSPS